MTIFFPKFLKKELTSAIDSDCENIFASSKLQKTKSTLSVIKFFNSSLCRSTQKGSDNERDISMFFDFAISENFLSVFFVSS